MIENTIPMATHIIVSEVSLEYPNSKLAQIANRDIIAHSEYTATMFVRRPLYGTKNHKNPRLIIQSSIFKENCKATKSRRNIKFAT